MKRHDNNKTENAEFVWQGIHYSVPLRVISKYKVSSNETSDDNDTVSVEEVFADLINKYGKSGALLRGARHKEGLNQVEFAKIIGISQKTLSAMENGRRTIDKEIAKRIADKFGFDYRIFL